MSVPLAYLNGQFVPFTEARLPVWDYGVVQGATVTDMVRTFRGELFRAEQHLERFAVGRKTVGITLPESESRLREILQEVLASVRPVLPAGGDCGVLMFATPGPFAGYAGFEPLPISSQRPTLCVHAFPLSFSRFAQGYQQGVSLAVPKVRHIPAECLPPTIKYRSRLHWHLADREARLLDAGSSALLLDQHNCVTETGTGNLFVVRDGLLLTPRAETTLPGISQAYVMELARAADMAVERLDMTPEFVRSADEVMLSSTTYCLMPVTRLNGHTIGDGRPGPVFQQLLARWSEAVGVDILQQALAAQPPFGFR